MTLDSEKMDLVDSLFKYIDVGSLKEAIEPFVIVGKLKGEVPQPGPLAQMNTEMEMLRIEFRMLQSEFASPRAENLDLRYCVEPLSKAVVKPHDPDTYSAVSSLKSKFNIW